MAGGPRHRRSVERDPAQEVEVAEHLAGAHHDRRQRIVGDRHRKTRLLAQALVEVLEQGTASGEDDAAIDDVGRELGRRLLERDADRFDDRRHRLGQRLADLLVGDHDRLRNAFDEIAALDLHGDLLVERERRAELDLHLLGGALADEQVVLALDVLDDRFVHLVAGDPDRTRVDDAGHRDHGDVRRPAADVEDHVAGRLGDRQPRADRGHHRLLDEEDLGRLGLQRRVAHRALLDLGDLARHSDHDARPHPELPVVRLLDEVGRACARCARSRR